MSVIMVTGAAGQLGRCVIRKLKERVEPSALIGLVRSFAKAKDLGITLREADYTKPETLIAAFVGVDTVLLISGTKLGELFKQHCNVITAARQAGVKRIVYTSIIHADTSPLNFASEHSQTEGELKTSGLNWTTLRNGWYTENQTASIDAAIGRGMVKGSAGDAQFSSAPRVDYAEAAAVVLTTPGHDSKTYELAGDESYDLSQLAAEYSRQSSTTVVYEDMPEADFAEALLRDGLPKEEADCIASWDVGAKESSTLFEDGHQLSTLIGRPTTPLSAVVAHALAAIRHKVSHVAPSTSIWPSL
jgi:NAD(P)H dehydrogenase (quinone)